MHAMYQENWGSKFTHWRVASESECRVPFVLLRRQVAACSHTLITLTFYAGRYQVKNEIHKIMINSRFSDALQTQIYIQTWNIITPSGLNSQANRWRRMNVPYSVDVEHFPGASRSSPNNSNVFPWNMSICLSIPFRVSQLSYCQENSN